MCIMSNTYIVFVDMFKRHYSINFQKMFLRMMAICMTQKDALHQDVLDRNIDMIFDKMFEYIFEE